MCLSGKDYSRILRAWLDCIKEVGNLALWRPLQATLREGGDHQYSSWIRETIEQFVQDVDYTVDRGVSWIALRVCQEALAVVFDPFQDLTVKYFYLDDIFLPVLLRCSSESLEAMLCGKGDFKISGSGADCNGKHDNGVLIQQIITLVTKNINLISSINEGSCNQSTDEINTSILQACCCFSMLETVYDRWDNLSVEYNYLIQGIFLQVQCREFERQYHQSLHWVLHSKGK